MNLDNFGAERQVAETGLDQSVDLSIGDVPLEMSQHDRDLQLVEPSPVAPVRSLGTPSNRLDLSSPRPATSGRKSVLDQFRLELPPDIVDESFDGGIDLFGKHGTRYVSTSFHDEMGRVIAQQQSRQQQQQEVDDTSRGIEFDVEFTLLRVVS